jgi:endonuclease/exonuclease/phosphatase family metal-dependent hydrolase
LPVRAIRIVTINLWNDAGQAKRRMEVLLPALVALEPHIVGLQEVRQSARGDEHQAERIARALDGDFRFVASDPHSAGGPVGNAIVSRFPIAGHETLELPHPENDPRTALRCDLTTPCGRLVMVTTHLSWELHAAPVRERQAVALDAFARARPGDLPTVLCGDFNCTPDSLVHQFLTGRASLEGRGTYWRDAFQRRHPRSDGFTWAARNPYVARNVERDRRIDYIFVAAMREGGPGAIVHARVVLDMPGPDEIYPTDHFGVFAELSCEPVQHAF